MFIEIDVGSYRKTNDPRRKLHVVNDRIFLNVKDIFGIMPIRSKDWEGTAIEAGQYTYFIDESAHSLMKRLTSPLKISRVEDTIE